jgi:hypothetical protein
VKSQPRHHGFFIEATLGIQSDQDSSSFSRRLLCRRVLVQAFGADAGLLFPQAFEEMSPA